MTIVLLKAESYRRGEIMKRAFKLVFEQVLIKEPIIFLAARDHNLVLNIRRARITSELGEATVELEGEEQDINKAITHLKSQGVIVDDAIGEEGL